MTGGWEGPPLPPHWTAAGQLRLVGRDAQLRTLRDAWARAAGGSRQVVLVGAESGGGKSRLVIEAATWCARSGAAVLAGGCVPELGSPYQPFAEPVEVLAAALGNGALRSAAPDDGSGALLGLVAGRPAAPPTGAGAGAGAGAGQEYRPRLYGAVVDAVRAATSVRPVVLVLEDVHWAAPDGLHLLTYLVEHSGDVPLLVLATYRTSAPDRGPAVVSTLTGLYRLPGVQRLDLPPLGVAAVAELLRSESSEPPSRIHEAAHALHRHTGGNPFFLREVWRDLLGHGGLAALRAGPLRAPESVRDTFQVRLDALPGQTRQLLELAAVLGDEVDADTLLALAAVSPAPAGPDGVLAALDAAVALALFDPVDGPGCRYRFRHALARQAVLDLMPPSRLTRSHAMAAEFLERCPGADRWVQRLAHHCASARPLGFGERAVRYLVEAARVADRALAHGEAAGLYEQAAAVPEAAGRRHELWLMAARSHSLAGNFPRALALDDDVFARGEPRERLAAAIGYEAASWHLGQRGHGAVERLNTALAAVDRDPSDPLYVRGISGLGRALAFSGAIAEASAVAARAIQLARALGRDDLLADVLQAGHHIGTTPESSATRLGRAYELTALAKRTGDLGQLCSAGYQRATIAYLRGEPRQVEEAHADMVQAARATGQPFWEYVAGGYDYARHYLAGDLEAADRAAQQLRERGRALGAADHAEGPFGLQTFMVRREAGRLEQIRPLITGKERPSDLWAPGLLALYTELGLTGPVRQVLSWLLDEGLDHYESSGDWPATLVFLAEAALAQGDETAAQHLRPRLAEYAGLNLAAGPFVAVFGSADRYLGAVDSLLGRRGAAEELESALAMDTRMAAPLHVAHSLAAQVVHLRRVRAPAREVAAVAERARQVAEPLGLRRVLRIAGVGGASARSGPDGLTSRELEILRLLAGGLSNRAIARRLVISESTAANHVRSIFLKTGAANRTQAARYASAHHLVD